MKRRDEIIWNNINRISKEKGWNLTRLAKEAGTNTSALNNIKSGVRGIGNDLLKKFADAFKVDQAVLLSESIISPTKEGKTLPEGTSNDLLVLLIKEQSKRMDEMQIMINRVMDVTTRYRNEVDQLGAVVGAMNNRIAGIKTNLLNYAITGDIQELKKVAGD